MTLHYISNYLAVYGVCVFVCFFTVSDFCFPISFILIVLFIYVFYQFFSVCYSVSVFCPHKLYDLKVSFANVGCLNEVVQHRL